MEEKDQEMIRRLCDENPRFRLLYEEHLLLEKELAEFEQRHHLNPEDEVLRKKVQKMKLAGRDEMERIFQGYRS